MPDLRLKGGEGSADRMHAGMVYSGMRACITRGVLLMLGCVSCMLACMSRACGHAPRRTQQRSAVTMLQCSMASDTRQHVSGLYSSVSRRSETMSQHDSSLTQDTIGALVRMHRGGEAGKECLIIGSRMERVLPIRCMRA